jgi:carboxymethylenebutenolidase
MDGNGREKKPGGNTRTGVLSEEEFKRLHSLRADQAPPPLGSPVDIEGSACYLTLPRGGKPPLPGIVVVHEWWGLNDHIRHWSDRLAADGYAALAVDLYRGKVAANPESAMAYVKEVDETDAMRVLEGAARFLREDPRVRAPRVGVIGWCFGGSYALRLGLADPALNATVMYYGRVVTDPTKLRAIGGSLLGIFADRDKSIPPEQVDDFDAALTKAGVQHTILRYDANHAFANPSGAAYNEPSAADAWKHVREFLAANLKR